jgi:hypothetical protein
MAKLRNTSAAAAALSAETVHDALAPPAPPTDKVMADIDRDEAAASVADDQKCNRADEAVRDHDYNKLLRQRQEAYDERERHAVIFEEKRKARCQELVEATPPAAERLRKETIKLLQDKITKWRDFDTLPQVGVAMTAEGKPQVIREEARRQAALDYRKRWADRARDYVGLCLEARGPDAYKFLREVYEFFSAAAVNPIAEDADEPVRREPVA